MLPCSEKVRVYDLREKEKSYAEVAKTCGNNVLSVRETVTQQKRNLK